MTKRPAPDDLPHIPITRFQKSPGDFLDLADRAPVVLTEDGNRRSVILSAAEYERLDQLERYGKADQAVLENEMDGAGTTRRD